jgi:hypothetical protein
MPFVILTRGRTGSTFLADALNQQPGVRCFQELLSVACPICSTGTSFLDGSYEEAGECQCFVHSSPELSIASWLSEVELRALRRGASRVGLKVLARALDDWPGLREVLRDHVSVIVLTRDGLDEALSGGYANAIGRWNVPRNSGDARELRELQRTPVQIDADWVVDEIRYSLAWRASIFELIRECKKPSMHLDFGELTGGRAGINRVLRFLGCPPAVHVEDRLERNLVDPSRQISNLDEILSAVRKARITADR